MEQLRVLVVEHQALVAARLKAQLERLGHQVVALVRDGREAMVAAHRLEPDLILMESRLPGLDGIDATRAIVSERAIPVVLITAYTAADLHRRAREAGVLAYLKPVNGKELRSAIEAAVKRFGEFRVVRREVRDQGEVLETRKLVERAKRVLMARLKLSEAEAFRHIQAQSRRTRKDLRETAWTLLGLDELVVRQSGLARCLQLIFQTVQRDLGAKHRWTPSAPRTAARAVSGACLAAGSPPAMGPLPARRR